MTVAPDGSSREVWIERARVRMEGFTAHQACKFTGCSSRQLRYWDEIGLVQKEQLIFPEIEYDKVDKVRGMDVVIVTTAKTDEEARELLTQMGMPFTK